MSSDEPSIESVAAEVEVTRDRLEDVDVPVPDPSEASSREEWTAYAYAKLGAAAEELRQAEAGGEASAGRSELVDLAEALPEGRAVSSAERAAMGGPSLAGRVEEMVADLDAALDLGKG